MRNFLKAIAILALFLLIIGAVVVFPFWAGSTAALSKSVTMTISGVLGATFAFSIGYVITEY